jgi:hypothetical protein
MPRRNPQRIDPQLTNEIEQLSSTEKDAVLKFAAMRTRIMAKAGIPVSDDEPSILLHEAITDTLTAVVTWDRDLHERLVQHLCNVVHSRTSNQIKKAKKRSSISLDVAGDDALPVDGNHAPVRPDVIVERAQLVQKLLCFVREHASALDDVHVLSIVDAYDQRIFKRREVMSATRLRLGEFLNARRRLDRMLATAPEELRPSDTSRDAMAACCRRSGSLALERVVSGTKIAQPPRRSPSTRGAPTGECASRFAQCQRFAHELAAVLRNTGGSDSDREMHGEAPP